MMSPAELLQWLSQHGRPLFIAVALILIVSLLLRPSKAPPPAAGAACSSSQSAGSRRQAISISTSGVIIEFRGGSPHLMPDAVAALVTLASRADIYLVTQLEQDSDTQEAAVMELLDGAGIFASDRRASVP